jgi:NitT/TauT family transport system permease protein
MGGPTVATVVSRVVARTPKPRTLAEALRARPTLVRFASVATFLVVWEAAGRQINPIFMSHPTAIARAFWALLVSGELVTGILRSLVSFVIGMVVSILGGIALGVLIGKFWWVEYVLDPFINALYAIPRIALVPLIILWFGLELAGKIVIVVSIAIFPVLINTYAGVKDVRSELLDIGRVYAATESQIFYKIVLPAAVPFIMAGVRLSVGVGIIGMIVAEFFTAVEGLGGMIVLYSNQFATAKVFVPIIVLGTMGIALTQGVMWLERRLAPWKATARGFSE